MALRRREASHSHRIRFYSNPQGLALTLSHPRKGGEKVPQPFQTGNYNSQALTDKIIADYVTQNVTKRKDR